jgi:hypothetical protein
VTRYLGVTTVKSSPDLRGRCTKSAHFTDPLLFSTRFSKIE